MTRRRDPYERTHEFGEASLPLVFDLHAMIFSDDAPALEAQLHGHFDSNRLNRINNRKEFFRADLKKIETVLRENYDLVVDLVYHVPAEHFRESQRFVEMMQA